MISYHEKSRTEDKWKIDKNNRRNPSSKFVFGVRLSVNDIIISLMKKKAHQYIISRTWIDRRNSLRYNSRPLVSNMKNVHEDCYGKVDFFFTTNTKWIILLGNSRLVSIPSWFWISHRILNEKKSGSYHK